MNDLPRHTLTGIILEHGRDICGAPKRVEALLRDLCGACRREINIIIGALEERVAADLMAAGETTVPHEVLLARLAARLRDNLAYTPEAARWGVETWAVALGVLSEEELREYARRGAAERERSGAPPHVQDTKPSAAEPARVAPRTSQPPRGTTPAPPAQSSHASKASPPPPTIFTPSTPATRRLPAMRPNAPATRAPQQNAQPTPAAQNASRRGLTLRGCLFAVMLIIILVVAAVFVVPAVIMILKEEQAQPSINDPRIR